MNMTYAFVTFKTRRVRLMSSQSAYAKYILDDIQVDELNSLSINNASKLHLQTFSIIIFQSSKFSFSCVSLVESVSRDIEEIRLSSSHQRTSLGDKCIIHRCAITKTRDLWAAENRECFVNHIHGVQN